MYWSISQLLKSSVDWSGSGILLQTKRTIHVTSLQKKNLTHKKENCKHGSGRYWMREKMKRDQYNRMCLEQYLTNSKENPKHCFGTSTEWEWIWKRIIIKECSCHPSCIHTLWLQQQFWFWRKCCSWFYVNET